MQFPDPVLADEFVARFILESSKYRISDMRVTYSAFMPARDNTLSVFRTDNLTQDQIIALGKEFVASPQAREVQAYGTVKSSIFFDQDLQMLPTSEPHPRHVDVIGWTEKEANRSRAQIIAEFATLVVVKRICA